ncbi:molybdenum cofactor cytidylyltransferase [Loktanella fryxellensis]|uniref:Molybdenum cofactor cytidylyltransferase n=1 Tax=Loktanella fryxellensis TaxID=245187 RepID=A0A1H7YUB6_9RHOB|nr:molybdopterin-binding protein [Loktanella fryxellensis]SEM49553.1 molybdenum cofactor cytidylyltransferase [Loktanella fryxellensis]
MKFGPVPLAEALGGVLAHQLGADTLALPKGHVLTADDLHRLAAAGVAHVTIARLEAGDVDEDTAAATIAAALTGPATGLRRSVAATGRVNVIADGPGLVTLDVSAVHAVNAVHPMITLATVPPLQRMEAGGLVATVKIIAYAVARTDLDAACRAGAGALGLTMPVIDRVALIETQAGRDLGDKGMRSLIARLDRLGVAFAGRSCVNHDAQAIAQALESTDAPLVCILTATATSDIADTAPMAVRLAGGTVDHFGMPVDPGNLLFLGRHAGRPVIGLPGCARSPALNGADWVLERLICGMGVTPRDIAAMGVGGLLKEIPSRPRPRRIDAAASD